MALLESVHAVSTSEDINWIITTDRYSEWTGKIVHIVLTL